MPFFLIKKTNVISEMQNISFNYKGAFKARPDDEVALGFARIPKGFTGFDKKYNAELYYRAHIADWLIIQPNVQYIHHVGAISHGNNEWVAGLKFNTIF